MLNVSNAGFMGEIWKRTRNESDIGDKGPVQLVFVEDIAVFVGGEVASVVPRLPEQAGQQWRKRTGAGEGKDRAGTGWTAVAGKKLERGKGRAESSNRLDSSGPGWLGVGTPPFCSPAANCAAQISVCKSIQRLEN